MKRRADTPLRFRTVQVRPLQDVGLGFVDRRQEHQIGRIAMRPYTMLGSGDMMAVGDRFILVEFALHPQRNLTIRPILVGVER